MAWIVLPAIIVLPLLEIAAFVAVANSIGLGEAIVLAIAAGVLGLVILRQQGMVTLERARRAVERGEVPVAEVFDAIALLAAGVLLLLPGFLTDVLALLLILPPVRQALRRWLAARTRAAPQGGERRPPLIEGEFTEIDPDDEPRNRR